MSGGAAARPRRHTFTSHLTRVLPFFALHYCLRSLERVHASFVEPYQRRRTLCAALLSDGSHGPLAGCDCRLPVRLPPSAGRYQRCCSGCQICQQAWRSGGRQVWWTWRGEWAQPQQASGWVCPPARPVVCLLLERPPAAAAPNLGDQHRLPASPPSCFGPDMPPLCRATQPAWRGGMVIQLSHSMLSVYVDPAAKTAVVDGGCLAADVDAETALHGWVGAWEAVWVGAWVCG